MKSKSIFEILLIAFHGAPETGDVLKRLDFNNCSIIPAELQVQGLLCYKQKIKKRSCVAIIESIYT